ncbi:ribonuclease H-like domain-containing protein [bacterium]|nr:ribonuclease H-like domain-containing protein [bacterium]
MNYKLYKNDFPSTLNFKKMVAIDTETMGLNINRDRLCLVQVCFGDDIAHLLQLSKQAREKPKNLIKLLQNKTITKIFHYGRFDLAMLNKNVSPVVGPIYCTKIASKLSRTFGAKHGLKDLCKDLLNIELDKFNQTSDWGTKILSKAQLAYAAQDVLFLHKIKIKLDEILVREGKMNLALECFESLKTRVKLDLEGFQELDIFAH